MEQLIFVGIIVLFSILEAVARKGRANQGGEEAPPLPEEPHRRPPRLERRSRAEPHSGDVPHSYDEDASFDEAAKGDESRMRPEPVQERAAPIGEGSAPPATSSEGLIPADVWDEIQRMARGELPEPQKAPPPLPPSPPAPAPAPRRPVESRAPEGRPPARPKPTAQRPRPSGKAKPTQRAGASTAQARTGKTLGRPAVTTVEAAPAAEGTADHPVHLAHEAFGTAPSQRAGIPLEGRTRSAASGAEEVRKLLSSDRRSLRHAVVLQEVLGPPPGLRDG